MGARQTQCKRNELWRAPMLLFIRKQDSDISESPQKRKGNKAIVNHGETHSRMSIHSS